MTPEGINTQYLKRRVKDLGGIARKCTWSGIAGAPDWRIAFPSPQCHAWVELKAPGKASRPLQGREQRIMRQGGCSVFVCDSAESIDSALSALFEKAKCEQNHKTE